MMGGPVPWDGKITKQHMMVRIVRRQKRILKRARGLLRGSRNANHLYKGHHYVVLTVLRQHIRKSYMDTCRILEVCSSLLEEFGLRSVPH